jgi:hypothetical protein
MQSRINKRKKHMEKEPITIGIPPWTEDAIRDHLGEFQEIYDARPIKDNTGGMRSAHMFAVWFIARQINPEFIVESGIFKGQSTWLLEVACPDARIVSIDPNLEMREYISNRAEYSNKDFSEHDWSDIPDNSLAFFDDHQNALRRTQQCIWFGFQNVIFEDNYPHSQGDCYSLKKVWAGSGFGSANPSCPSNGQITGAVYQLLRKSGLTAASAIPEHQSWNIPPNLHDAKLLRKWLEIYYEFPPIYKRELTRWGDKWDDSNYPTPEPLLAASDKAKHPIFYEEATTYTWICYIRLKSLLKDEGLKVSPSVGS